MIKLKALNHELSSDDDAPTIRKEAQEEIAFDLYNKALRLQFNNEHAESISILKQLLEENIPQLQAQGGLPKTMSTIKYSCYVNIGVSALKTDNEEEAIEYYLMASELDGTDVTLWYKIGKLALKLDRFNQAAVAFSRGLECNDEHWPCIDNLISVLYTIENYIGCLDYIRKALTIEKFYIKGLVLRKHIYTDNPAISIYFPDFKLEEHDLNEFIEPKDDKVIMEEIDAYSERLTKAQKSLMPQKIVAVPLPKPLEKNTWLSLGVTVTTLHQYIAENSLSHFSTIDQNEQSVVLDSVEEPIVVIESADTPQIEPMDLLPVSDVDVVPSEESAVRRMSMNSETDKEKDTTPNQTDNDEMEQDTEDQDEPADQLKGDKVKAQIRSTKRKRDLLSDLQIWGWHSKRKQSKKGKYERELTVEEALTRIIPSQLLSKGLDGYKFQNEDSTATIEMYNLHVEASKPTMKLISPIGSPSTLESSAYFGSDIEKTDVVNFWAVQSLNDSVTQVIEFVQHLASKWDEKWPDGLLPIYIDAYNMYREHYSYLQECNETPFKSISRDALCTLLYAESITFQSKRGKIYTGDNLAKVNTSTIYYLEHCALGADNWGEKYANYVIRVLWLKAHVLQNNAANKLAICTLKMLSDFIHEDEENTKQQYSLILPNCDKSNVITMELITRLVKKIGMIDSVNRLESLFEAENYKEVTDIVKMTFGCPNPVEHTRVGRQAQLGMLLHALWFTDRTECFIWSEVCLHEAIGQYVKSDCDERWEMVVENCLGIIYDIVKTETVSAIDILPVPARCRFVTSLSILCSRQVNCDGMGKIPLDSVIPWILLHYVILREEHRQQAKKIVQHVIRDEDNSKNQESSDEDDTLEIPASVAILFSAHEFLGPKGSCIVKQGELLHFILDTIVDRLDTPIFESLREKIDIHLEQAFFCLYQHPSKKNKISRHLADHNVDPLPLSWARAQQLYEFFCPAALPEFDSYKSISISAELEQLLQRICALVPADCDPNPTVSKVSEYVRGVCDTLPAPIEFPHRARSMYYLLGDFFFKQSEVKRSYRYFLLDLCINPDRVDTWACIALGNASQLEAKLNHCERFKSEQEFLDKARSTRVCFQRALQLAGEHATLWIEFGSFEYMAHSFCSRLLKCESETLSMERFEMLESKKEDFLQKSQFNFTRALELYQPDQNEADERWLYYYILGKIAEKQQKEPNEYLQLYLTAQTLLHENKATYPEKINYNNPQHLSLEALELHYRINSSILKYLELHEGKPIPTSIGKVFRKCLEESLFVPDKRETPMEVAPIPVPTPEPVPDQVQVVEPEVQAPSVIVQTPGVMVQAPSVMVQAPSVMVQAPSVMVQAPSVMVQTPSVMVPTPSVIIIEQQPDNRESVLVDSTGSVDVPPDTTEVVVTSTTNEICDAIVIKDDEDVVNSDVVEGTVVVETTERDIDGKVEDVQHAATTAGDTKEDNEPTSTTETKPTADDSSSSSSSSSSSDSDSDDSSSSSSSSSSASTSDAASASVNMSEYEISNLIDRCLQGLEQCIKRLPQNYKALYRIAHLYFAYSKKRDLSKCKQLFLTDYKCKNGVMVSGLFSDRKPSNLFNGVWRIPSSEIDRPGSLAAHMARCVALLLQVLRDSRDHRTLLDLCLLLRRVPDPDKMYVRHAEREQLAEQAGAMCAQAVRAQIRDLNAAGGGGAGNGGATERLLQDVFRAYQRAQKALGAAEERMFGGMLVEIYRKLMVDIRLPDNINILDLAIKYCQQSRAADKLKKQQTARSNLPSAINFTASGSTGLTAGPTSATPTISAIPTAALLPPQQQAFPSLARRPSMGRPRGRPPGPKMPGLPKSPRGRPPLTKQSPYGFPFYPPSYDYMKKYQDELMRQYSQLVNPFMTTNASSLLSSASLMQQLQNSMATATSSLHTTSLTASLSSLASSSLNTLGGTNIPGASAGHMNLMPGLPSTANLLQQLPTTSGTMSNEAIMQMAAALIQSGGNSTTASLLLAGGLTPSTSGLMMRGNTTGVTNVYNSGIPSAGGGGGSGSGFKLPAGTTSKAKEKDSKVAMAVGGGIGSGGGSVPVKELLKQAAAASSYKKTAYMPPSDHSKPKTTTTTTVLKDRPNISITPVMSHITPHIPPMISPPQRPATPSPTKTLQEKLADKQKQQQLAAQTASAAKSLDFSGITKQSNTHGTMSVTTTIGSKAVSIPKSLDVIPSYMKDTSVTISPVLTSTSADHLPKTSPPKANIDLPISLSVIKTLEEKQNKKPVRKESSDDDVIFIE